MEKLQPLILQSIELLVIGMGTVFVILGLLIFLINLVTRVLSSLQLEEEPSHFGASASTLQPVAKTADGELVAVITSAIARYRKQYPRP